MNHFEETLRRLAARTDTETQIAQARFRRPAMPQKVQVVDELDYPEAIEAEYRRLRLLYD
jgi:hypothetical protein